MPVKCPFLDKCHPYYLLVTLFFMGMIAANIFGLSLYSKIARKSDYEAQEAGNNGFTDVVVNSASTETQG